MKTAEEQQQELKDILSTFNVHLTLPERRSERRSGVVTYKNQTCWMESRDKNKALIRLPDFSLLIVDIDELTL
jgi:hypothetical protein